MGVGAALASAAYDPEAWRDFAVAVVGAAAALAGLLVVSASINITRVLEFPSIIARLGATLAVFGGVLVVGVVLLVPGIGRLTLGVAVAAVGALLTALVLRLRGIETRPSQYRGRATVTALITILAAALLTAAGVLCAAEVGGGLYWLAPGVTLSFVAGLVNSWVALVEILR